MADSWEQAMLAVITENEGTMKPSSWAALARALAAEPDSPQTNASWKKTIARIRQDNRLSEETAVRIAKALGVSRRRLPPSSVPVTLADLDRRLEELAELVAEGFQLLGADVAGRRPA